MNAYQPKSSFDRHDVMRKGYVTEVSVLTAGHEPLEPGARVLTLRRSPAGASPPFAPAGATSRDVVIPGNGQLIRRPNIGQVLGVR